MAKKRDPRFKFTEEKEKEIWEMIISGKFNSHYIMKFYSCAYNDIVNIKRRNGYYDKHLKE